MNALVVYDSLYGNTKEIAQAIGEALAPLGPVQVESVADVSGIPAEIDLLVIGGPTHGHTISEGTKRFLAGIAPKGLLGITVATFDTRVDWPVILSGSAARGIGKQVQRMGGLLVGEPGSFIVDGREGPLRAGELDRAVAWAKQLVAAIPAQAA